MITKSCKLQDPEKVRKAIEEYFSQREKDQEVRELKNGDKRVYRTPPSIWALCQHLGISEDTFARHTANDEDIPESYNKEICGLLVYAKQRIINELYEGVCLGYWNEKVVMAQLQKFGVIGDTEADTTVKIIMQGDPNWSK